MYEERAPENPLQRLMVCHRMPPTCIALYQGNHFSMFSAFPIVTAHNFCHEFRYDPERDAVNEPSVDSVPPKMNASS